MDPKPGTYALVLQNRSCLDVQIGRWGTLQTRPGYYLYIGSAFGPGGVQARVSRHCRTEKARRWHIDYLREHMTPVCCWYSHSPERLEHQWAGILASLSGVSAIKGFGCSDCRCCSHLFVVEKLPALDEVFKSTGDQRSPLLCKSCD